MSRTIHATLNAVLARLKALSLSLGPELEAQGPQRASADVATDAPHGGTGEMPGVSILHADDSQRAFVQRDAGADCIARSADCTCARLPAPANDTGSALQGLAVLVAEDNALVQAMIAEQLTRLGCLPTITGDGQQALAALAHTHFDVVLSDIDMPVMDGYELLAHLRVSHASLPVLAFSAGADNRRNDGWREHGFAGYVAKSVSADELAAALLEVAPGRRRAAQVDAVPSQPATAVLDPDDEARRLALLKTHLQSDLPKLMTIVDDEDRDALRGWAHGAGGAFLIVREMRFARQCIELQRLCDDSERWTTEMDERAISLHDELYDRFDLDEDSMR
jgi:two-component system capsular synthesis sensor histidine kinase RcsC